MKLLTWKQTDRWAAVPEPWPDVPCEWCEDGSSYWSHWDRGFSKLREGTSDCVECDGTGTRSIWSVLGDEAKEAQHGLFWDDDGVLWRRA